MPRLPAPSPLAERPTGAVLDAELLILPARTRHADHQPDSVPPAGRSGRVCSHDAVAGATVAIVYRTDQPRRVRLADGRRSHAWKNTLPLWVIYFGLVPLVILLLFRRQRRARRGPG